MNSLAKMAFWGAVVLLSGFFGVVFWNLFTGRISLNGLLEADVRDPKSSNASGFSAVPSAGRAQALVATLFVAGWYLLQVIHNPKEFPHLPDALVTAMGGSHFVYLSGKAYGLLSYRLKDVFRTGG
jgi:hypothetical protein